MDNECDCLSMVLCLFSAKGENVLFPCPRVGMVFLALMKATSLSCLYSSLRLAKNQIVSESYESKRKGRVGSKVRVAETEKILQSQEGGK